MTVTDMGVYRRRSRQPVSHFREEMQRGREQIAKHDRTAWPEGSFVPGLLDAADKLIQRVRYSREIAVMARMAIKQPEVLVISAQPWNPPVNRAELLAERRQPGEPVLQLVEPAQIPITSGLQWIEYSERTPVAK